jgi:aminopeptidase N
MRRRLVLLLFIGLETSLATAQRLPELAIPENYRLSFVPNFEKDNFAGEETIQIRVLKPTSQIVLNAAAINFQNASINSGGTLQKAKITLDKAGEMAILAVATPLSPGSATIQIHYTGILNNELRGFYLGKLANGKKYAATQFEATDARRAFPCFDEPAYKATFDITVVADKSHIAISNGKVVSDTRGPGAGKHTVRFATTAKMSSYLVAMVVGDFEYVQGSADGTPIRVYGPPGSKAYSTYALGIGEQCLNYFDQYFGVKYPFEKLDMIGLPDFAAGAMENTGLITYRETLLQLDDARASVEKHTYVATIIAHEISHQWFGDLVTMKWWDDIWLNEGFATWMENKAVQTLRPEWNLDLEGVKHNLDALNVDSLQNTRPIHQAAHSPVQIQELFDDIAYQKAGAVLGMVEAYIGPETFRAGVHEYLKNYSFGNARAEDFWNTVAAVSKEPVDRVMASFVNQPGAPLVSLKLQCNGGSATATLSQQRYFYDRTLFSGMNDELWEVPVCMKEAPGGPGARSPEECVLLSKREESFPLSTCADWILADAGAKGYYRSGYETDRLQAISRDLERGIIPAERMMLLGNLWAAVRVGRQQIGDFLAFAEGLQSDRNRAVVGLLADQIEYIARYLVTETDRDSFERWVRRLLTPVAQDLGWRAKPSGESDEQKSLRARILHILGSAGRDQEVLAEARRLTEEGLKNPEAVDRTLAETVFSLAAVNGDAALYDRFLDHLQNARTREEYYIYLGALSSFGNPQLLERTLEYALTLEVRSQDKPGVIAAVLENGAGERLAWNFVREHWSEIDTVNSGFISGEIVGATSTFCDSGLRNEVNQFFSTHNVAVAERTLRQSLERINYCVDLKSQQAPKLAAWLQQRGAATGK